MKFIPGCPQRAALKWSDDIDRHDFFDGHTLLFNLSSNGEFKIA